MTITSKTYTTVAGTNYIQAPELRFVTILDVRREGAKYDLVLTGSAGNRQAKYTSSNGRLAFLNAFTAISGGPSLTPVGGSPAMIPEKVFVKWKY